MRFTTSSIITALAVVSAVASPIEKETTKRDAATQSGSCNGTSCRVFFYNLHCSVGSCVGPEGGDGKSCTIVDYADGSNKAFCPGCGNPDLC
ncbi:hypothetical protein F5B19DRAFT_501033 [Rostrohypoxylon terebratum]|nr:hypothetical protein F5B19DRAFT_501033 [Rostrohypoxylon terebratum]